MSDERLNLPSASSFYADVACNGRQNLLRQLPQKDAVAVEDPEMAELAARGTRIHESRRTGNTFALKDEPEVEAYKNACEIEKRVVETWMQDNDIEVIGDPIVEERLWLNHPVTMAPILSGQEDVIFLAGRHALCCDWKSGSTYYVGDVGKSWQTRVYALLAWKEWPQLKRIRVAFIKPEAFGPKQDVADFTEYDLQQIEQAVLHTIWKSQQPDAELRAGPQCRFCAAKSICNEAARYAMTPIAESTAGSLTAKEDIGTVVSLMPVESALGVWQKRGAIKNIMEAISARLAALPAEELDRLGLKLTAGKKIEKVKDIVGAFNALRSTGLSSEQVLSCMKFTKESVVKAYQAMTNCRDQEGEAFWNATLGEFIERDRAKPSLVEK